MFRLTVGCFHMKHAFDLVTGKQRSIVNFSTFSAALGVIRTAVPSLQQISLMLAAAYIPQVDVEIFFSPNFLVS